MITPTIDVGRAQEASLLMLGVPGPHPGLATPSGATRAPLSCGSLAGRTKSLSSVIPARIGRFALPGGPFFLCVTQDVIFYAFLLCSFLVSLFFQSYVPEISHRVVLVELGY
jgi:hypothetical protein